MSGMSSVVIIVRLITYLVTMTIVKVSDHMSDMSVVTDHNHSDHPDEC